ncbi:MAG: hypothetical protein WBF57_10260, partial [Mycobacterium sp.]
GEAPPRHPEALPREGGAAPRGAGSPPPGRPESIRRAPAEPSRRENAGDGSMRRPPPGRNGHQATHYQR